MQTDIERRATGDARIPLDALIELSSTTFGRIEADALNVSAAGISVRASHVPVVGTKIDCRFEVPPMGQMLDLQGEVVWTQTTGPQMGEFGLRFISMEPSAALALRDLVAMNQGSSITLENALPEARVQLDGVASPIVAEVIVRNADAVSLAQSLPFLRLGQMLSISDETGLGRRGVLESVDLSIENDVPRLMLQITYETSIVDAVAPVSDTAVEDTTLMDVEAPVTDDELMEMRSAESSIGLSDDEADALRAMTIARAHQTQQVETQASSSTPKFDKDAALEQAKQVQTKLAAWTRIGMQAARVNGSKFLVWCTATFAVLASKTGAAWGTFSPRAKTWWTEFSARFGRFLQAASVRTSAAIANWKSNQAQAQQPKRVTAPAPQKTTKSTVTTRGGKTEAVVEETRKPLPIKMIAIGAGVVGGLGIAAYAMFGGEAEPALTVTPAATQTTTTESAVAPAAAAATTETTPSVTITDVAGTSVVAPTTPTTSTDTTQLAPAALAAPAPINVPVPTPTALGAPSYAAGPLPAPTYNTLATAQRPATATPAASPYMVDVRDTRVAGFDPTLRATPTAPVAPATIAAATPTGTPPVAPTQAVGDVAPRTLTYGAASVPNAQTFTFRMTAPITNVVGQGNRNEFTVELIGGHSLDRAAPIKTALRSVESAGIVNTGDRATLRIRFAAGNTPAYRVVTRGSIVELQISRR